MSYFRRRLCRNHFEVANDQAKTDADQRSPALLPERSLRFRLDLCYRQAETYTSSYKMTGEKT